MADSSTILGLWQAALGPAPGRALRLLTATGEVDPGRLALGEAMRRLIALRAGLMGDRLEAVCRCPGCGAVHEAAIATSDLLADAPPGDGMAPSSRLIEADGWRVEVRPLTLADFDDAARCPDADAAAALLRARAVMTAIAPYGADAEPLPAPVLDAIEAALDAADPLADARMAFTCATCGAAWTSGFDPASFLAHELTAAARRTMAEVAALARAYGWSERDILDIPPERRRVYLELAG